MSKATATANTETVKVMVRVRPMNKSEKDRGSKSVVLVDNSIKSIEISRPENAH